MSSAVSFYFAYDFCVFRGLSAEYSYLLKFLPFCITTVLCIVVVVHRCVPTRSNHDTVILYVIIEQQKVLPSSSSFMVWLVVGHTVAVHSLGPHLNVYP